MKYAGIGSRETPHETLEIMCQIGKALADRDWLLRSGGAEGADEAFIMGCESDVIDCIGEGGECEIFLPWPSFQGWDHRGRTPWIYDEPTDEAFDMAAEYHPRWNYLRQGARKLHARNMHIVLGRGLGDPVDLVICWTPGAKVAGGTGQALRVALDLGIPIRNLANESHREVILDALEADDFTQLY